MTRKELEKLRDAIASVAYDDLEGPVANQDYARQVQQWEQCKRIADAQLTALEAAGVRLVPVEATKQMLLAAHMVESDDIELTEDEHRAMYAAFLAASPYAPLEETGHE